jgi:hypothetical protein
MIICSCRHCHTAVQILNKLIPGFQDRINSADDQVLMLSPVSPYSIYFSLITNGSIQLQTGANDVRSDDTVRLKVVVADWLNSCKSKKTLHVYNDNGNDSDTPILSSKGKEEHGIMNNVTGHLLCPIDYDWDDPG